MFEEDMSSVDLEADISKQNPSAFNGQPAKKMSQVVTIGKIQIIQNFFTIVGLGLYSVLLATLYANMTYTTNKSVYQSDTSHLLLAMIITLVVRLVISYTTTIINLSHYGNIVSKNEYKRLMALKSRLYVIIKSVSMAMLHIIIIALAPRFVPFNVQHCNGYDDRLCGLCRLVAFFGIILIVIYGIMTLTIIYKLSKGIAINDLKKDNFVFKAFYNTSIFSLFNSSTYNVASTDSDQVNLRCGHATTQLYVNTCNCRVTLVKCPVCSTQQEIVVLKNIDTVSGNDANNPMHLNYNNSV